MKKLLVFAAALLALLPSAFAQQSSPAANEIFYVKGRLLVGARAGYPEGELDKELALHRGKRAGGIPRLNIHFIELPDGANELEVARALSKNPHVKFAELDRVAPPAMTPSDPSLTNQWYVPKLNAPVAWDFANGSGVIVAVLDTGVNSAHPDLAANMLAGWNFFNNSADTSDVYDHGTKVAGTIAMLANNGVGGAGVAFGVRIMPLRVSGNDGLASWSAMASAITYAADNGARVANLSYGVCDSSTIISAANYLRSKGGVLVVAAGNENSYRGVVSDSLTCAAATDSSDNRASFSNYGESIDIAAPGVGTFTTTTSGGYGSVSGTSFASPITAAVYALVASANRSLPPAQLDSVVFSSAVDRGVAGKDLHYGWGRVDAAAAVAKALEVDPGDGVAPSVGITAPQAGATVGGVVAVDVAASDNLGVSRVDLYANGTFIGSDTSAPFGFSWDSAMRPDGVVTLEARATDAAGNVGSHQVTVNVSNAPADTVAPEVAFLQPLDGAVLSIDKVSIKVIAADNVAVAKIGLVIDGKEVATSLGSSLTYQWTVRKGNSRNGVASGSHGLTAIATDAAGNTRITSITVTVQR